MSVKPDHLGKVNFGPVRTVKERHFSIGNCVQVGADYSQKMGIIVGLDTKIPYKAQVRLDTKSGITVCRIKSEHLRKVHAYKVFSRILKDEGFSVEDPC